MQEFPYLVKCYSVISECFEEDMSNAKTLSWAGTNAVKRLRLNKLRHGRPFMINSRELPFNQCYLEYPNGRIVLATLSSSTRDFEIVRELSQAESSGLRKKFDLEEAPY